MCIFAKKEQKNMILIADSGSTKTDWYALRSGESFRAEAVMTTNGMNPVRDTQAVCEQVLKGELLPQLEGADEVEEIRFFGAGCTPQFGPVVARALESIFLKAKVFVESDMLGAAIALCGHQEGIACILGTGSNSCYYDGEKLAQNVSPLGWILGDEGSGAVLGKMFVADLLKGLLPATLSNAFFAAYPLSFSQLIERVYRTPQANKFLASVVPFIALHREEPAIQVLIKEQFGKFVRRNVKQYGRPDLPVHFIGGVAWQFQDELRQVIEHEGLLMGRVEKVPMPSLVAYFS